MQIARPVAQFSAVMALCCLVSKTFHSIAPTAPLSVSDNHAPPAHPTPPLDPVPLLLRFCSCAGLRGHLVEPALGLEAVTAAR